MAPLCEVRVFSRRYRFAGTLDILGAWDGVTALIDYKTGAPADVAAELQTAAYCAALVEMHEAGEGSEALAFEALTHTYWLGGERLPSVTQVLQGAGLIDFSSIPAPILNAARDRGAAVHQACHFYNELALDSEAFRLDFPDYWPYLEAWIRFREMSGFVPLEDLSAITLPIKRYAIRLLKDGRYYIEPYGDPRDFRDFLALLQAQQIVGRRRPKTWREVEEVA